jgi:hypothetical protein
MIDPWSLWHVVVERPHFELLRNFILFNEFLNKQSAPQLSSFLFQEFHTNDDAYCSKEQGTKKKSGNW